MSMSIELMSWYSQSERVILAVHRTGLLINGLDHRKMSWRGTINLILNLVISNIGPMMMQNL